jgi:hypothetical protein
MFVASAGALRPLVQQYKPSLLGIITRSQTSRPGAGGLIPFPEAGNNSVELKSPEETIVENNIISTVASEEVYLEKYAGGKAFYNDLEV